MLSTARLLPLPFAAHRPARFISTNAFAESLIYPESKSPHHHDLPSYLEYASRTNVDPTSTTYVGTHYEYTVMAALEKFGMSLKQMGGAMDYGINLLGTWALPSSQQTLKVLIQCKTHYEGPSQARGLEGAHVGAPQGWRGSGALSLLVSQKIATRPLREALGRSRWPMGYVFCKSDGKILQMIWNRRAEQEGL